MPSDNSIPGFGPLFYDPSRATRLQTHQTLLNWSHSPTSHPAGFIPCWTIEPWYTEPSNPPWPRRPYAVPPTEVLGPAHVEFDLLVHAFRNRLPFVYQAVLGEPRPNAATHPDLIAASKAWLENAVEKGVEEEVAGKEVLGSEGAERDGMKFLVFRTVEVAKGVLDRFLDSAEVRDRGSGRVKAQTFSYFFADTETGDKCVESSQKAARREDLESWGESRLVGRATQEVLEAWEDMIRPVTGCRSLYATRCFLILDETTRDDVNTAQVVVISADGWHARRVSFEVLDNGILKAFEKLLVDPDMLELDDRGVITARSFRP